jgi:hypothetical protein
MEDQVKQTLETALSYWKSMSGPDNEAAESTANEFEASFYVFIDAVRIWFHQLEQQPQTLDDFLELPLVQAILERLPAQLYLNFETEAELIVEHISRVDDAKYD